MRNERCNFKKVDSAMWGYKLFSSVCFCSEFPLCYHSCTQISAEPRGIDEALAWRLIFNWKFRERGYPGDDLLIWEIGTTPGRVYSEMNYSKRRTVYGD